MNNKYILELFIKDCNSTSLDKHNCYNLLKQHITNTTMRLQPSSELNCVFIKTNDKFIAVVSFNNKTKQLEFK